MDGELGAFYACLGMPREWQDFFFFNSRSKNIFNIQSTVLLSLKWHFISDLHMTLLISLWKSLGDSTVESVFFFFLSSLLALLITQLFSTPELRQEINCFLVYIHELVSKPANNTILVYHILWDIEELEINTWDILWNHCRFY